MSIQINKNQLERFNIVPPELKPKTKTQLVNALNSASYQLDWLAQLLGFSNEQYWDDLNLSIFEKRKVLANAISCDPKFNFPLDKTTLTDYRIIDVTIDENGDLVLLDRTYPTLYLYGGVTYIFNVEQYPTFQLTPTEFGGALNTEDPTEPLFYVDRREEGYLIVIPSKEVSSRTIASYYGFNISTGVRETGWGRIEILPERNITDWLANRTPVSKDVTLDSWFDQGVEWFGSTIYDDVPIYPEYNREDTPPDGFTYVDSRPPLSAEEDFFSGQVFRYDNDFFESIGFPELVYRPSAFYDFFGIHGSKGAGFTFNFMVDALGYKGFNDKTLVIDSIQTNFENGTKDYEPLTAYDKGDVLIYDHSVDSEALENYLVQSWYYVQDDFTSADKPYKDIVNGDVKPLENPRKTVRSMRKDTRNDIIPLRLWVQRDLQVADENSPHLYDNKAIANVGYSNGEEVGIFHVRLPLEYERNGIAWQRINLLAKTYLYFGDEDPIDVPGGGNIRHQDYRVGYAYLVAGYSAADEAVFNPEEEADTVRS